MMTLLLYKHFRSTRIPHDGRRRILGRMNSQELSAFGVKNTPGVVIEVDYNYRL